MSITIRPSLGNETLVAIFPYGYSSCMSNMTHKRLLIITVVPQCQVDTKNVVGYFSQADLIAREEY